MGFNTAARIHLFCYWHVIRWFAKFEFLSSKSQILRNINLFSSSCLCPLGWLSFKQIKINVAQYSKFRQFDTLPMQRMMTCYLATSEYILLCFEFKFECRSTCNILYTQGLIRKASQKECGDKTHCWLLEAFVLTFKFKIF